jgi:hypothetical protein
MSVTATVRAGLDWKDISSSSYVKAGDASRSWDGGDLSQSLTSSSTPSIDGGATVTVTLAAGVATKDLTALLHQDGDTRTAAGKKLRAIHFYNPSTAVIVVTKGASNGHSPAGTTFTLPVAANGGRASLYFPDATAIVNATNDTFDFAGTGTDTLLMKLVWGT